LDPVVGVRCPELVDSHVPVVKDKVSFVVKKVVLVSVLLSRLPTNSRRQRIVYLQPSVVPDHVMFILHANSSVRLYK